MLTAIGGAPTPAKTTRHGAGWRIWPAKGGSVYADHHEPGERAVRPGIGIKEDIATYLEKFGDAKVVSVVEKLPEQLRMDGPPQRGAGPAERTRQAVYATGNKWAIENFEATHS